MDELATVYVMKVSNGRGLPDCSTQSHPSSAVKFEGYIITVGH